MQSLFLACRLTTIALFCPLIAFMCVFVVSLSLYNNPPIWPHLTSVTYKANEVSLSPVQFRVQHWTYKDGTQLVQSTVKLKPSFIPFIHGQDIRFLPFKGSKSKQGISLLHAFLLFCLLLLPFFFTRKYENKIVCVFDLMFMLWASCDLASF